MNTYRVKHNNTTTLVRANNVDHAIHKANVPARTSVETQRVCNVPTMHMYVRHDGHDATWRHRLEPAPPGWHDCTSMDDEAFEAFITALQQTIKEQP